MSKENWKKTGKELGGAFEGLAKTLIRSAKVGVDKAEEWAENDGNAPQTDQSAAAPESNVFNDGTWRETGKDLGQAFLGFGKTLLNTGVEGIEQAEKWASEEAAADNSQTAQAPEPEQPEGSEKQ